MPRLVGGLFDMAASNLSAMRLELLLGPTESSVEHLRVAWSVYGDELTRESIEGARRGVVSRPWGWWVFEQNEEPPHGLTDDGEYDNEAELTRLAELGVLEPGELGALRRRADEGRPLLDTGGEHWFWSHPPNGRASSSRFLPC
jgi:hypothetical protein